MPTNSPRPVIAECLEYPIDCFGGTEVLVAKLIALLHRDFEIVLVSPDPDITKSPIREYVSHHLPWQPEKADRAAAKELVAQLQRLEVATAHFHLGGTFAWSGRKSGDSPVVCAAEAGLRVFTTNHGFFSPLEGYCAFYRPLWMKLALFPLAWISKLRALHCVQREICVSDFDKNSMRKWYPPAREKFQRIYHSQLPAQDAPNLPIERARRIVCIGTFGIRKGQQILAEAFGRVAASFPDWELVFAGRVGDESIWRAVENVRAQSGMENRIRHVQGLDHLEIADLMRTSELFVMPSFFEGLGLALQEALYYGCACISTRSGGPADLIVDGDNGLLTPCGNVEALASALQRVMGDQILRERFRRRGPESIKERQMNADAMADEYRKLYTTTE